ncbi:MAG: tetratricopeptide repeat protein [bacterium]|nr:tetratricopeptide repeat protein [bacterium]
MGAKREILAICCGLALATVFAFAQLRNAEFLDFDDDEYVTANQHVLDGLTSEGFRWALVSFDANNWHPLTWLSHMLDQELFPGDPGTQHLVNVAFHLLNALGWFLLLAWMTDSIWPSALVAALFALHPLHVESVAWISERKDVLSGLFWIATSAAWVAWLRSGRRVLYGAAIAVFALGLATKPMLVTLPFTLLLFDFWPLSRLRAARLGAARVPLRRLVVEKLPLFALSLLASALTYSAHLSGGSMQGVAQLGLWPRVANALVAYARYLGKAIWPTNLSIYYPYTHAWTSGQVLASALALAAISFAAFQQRARRPYLIVGWLFFLGTLVPTIGIVQVGGQSMAERYTYLPYVGIFMALAWASVDALRFAPRLKGAGVVLVALLLVACAVQTHRYVSQWQDTLSVFSHAIRSYPDNPVALVTAGRQHAFRGESELAIEMFERALVLTPGYEKAHYNLGDARLARGELDAAAGHFEAAVQIAPEAWYAWLKLGVAHEGRGHPAEAEAAYRSGLALRPGNIPPRCRLAALLARRGQRTEAEAQLGLALRSAQARLDSGRRAMARESGRMIQSYSRDLGFEQLAEQTGNWLADLESHAVE